MQLLISSDLEVSNSIKKMVVHLCVEYMVIGVIQMLDNHPDENIIVSFLLNWYQECRL